MSTEIKTCYRHADRRAGVSCQRCDRPICPACMSSASVGFHCPECAKTGTQKVYTAGSLFKSRPLVTQVLIGINVAVFLAGLTQSSGDALSGTNGFSADYGLVGSFLTRSGSVFPGLGVANGEWYRLVTGGFLHAGVLHLGMNMFALWILGSQLEAAIGRVQFAAVYGASLLAGSLGVMILSPHELTVGASGAIFGLFGLALAAQLVRGISIWDSGLGGLLLINLAITFGIPGISIGGHLGGLAGGFVCGYILYELGPRVSNKMLPVAACGAIGGVCFVAALAVAQAAT